MKAEKGLVVKASAGRDSGKWFVVLKAENDFVWIADGKTRKIESSKKKNIKHIKVTNHHIELTSVTDKKLRVALKQFTD